MLENYKRHVNSSKKDKVLFINYNAYPCAIGGLEIFNLYLINELSKSYNTHVLTFCDKSSHDKILLYIK